MLSKSTPSPGASTVTSNVRSTLPPTGISRPAHVIVEPAAVPSLLTLAIPLKPLGTLSSTDTPVASLGPSLLTVIVNVMTSPTLGSGLSTILIKLISTTCGSTGSSSASSSSSGSAPESLGLSSSDPTMPSPSVSGSLPGSESGSN